MSSRFLLGLKGYVAVSLFSSFVSTSGLNIGASLGLSAPGSTLAREATDAVNVIAGSAKINRCLASGHALENHEPESTFRGHRETSESSARVSSAGDAEMSRHEGTVTDDAKQQNSGEQKHPDVDNDETCIAAVLVIEAPGCDSSGPELKSSGATTIDLCNSASGPEFFAGKRESASCKEKPNRRNPAKSRSSKVFLILAVLLGGGHVQVAKADSDEKSICDIYKNVPKSDPAKDFVKATVTSEGAAEFVTSTSWRDTTLSTFNGIIKLAYDNPGYLGVPLGTAFCGMNGGFQDWLLGTVKKIRAAKKECENIQLELDTPAIEKAIKEKMAQTIADQAALMREQKRYRSALDRRGKSKHC